jgi:pilus assembly protein CpaE
VESLVSLLPDTPILIFSESRVIDSARKAMLAGARDFLIRPVRPETLRQSVLKALEAAENRRLVKSGHVAASPTQGTVVTVFGAKGGIGKSTIATNMAVALGKHGSASVVIVDLDNGFGDISGMLNMEPERSLLELVRDIDKVDRDDLRKYLNKHEFSGIDLLSGPSILDWRKLAADDVRRVVDLLAQNYDIVVLDTSGILTEVTEMAVEAATIVLWVTTTEYASVRDSIEAMKALNMLSYSQERVRVVMNSISPDDSVRPTVIEQAMGREVFWVIPYDKKVRQGTHLGQPIVITSPASAAAKSLADLAATIGGARPEQKGKLGGFKWRFGGNNPAQAVSETT